MQIDDEMVNPGSKQLEITNYAIKSPPEPIANIMKASVKIISQPAQPKTEKKKEVKRDIRKLIMSASTRNI